MGRSHRRIGAVALFAAALLATSAFAGDRPADEILADYAAVQMPKYDPAKRGDQDYLAAMRYETRNAEEKRSALILELSESHPDHPKLAELLPVRWSILARQAAGDEAVMKALVKELDAAVRTHKGDELAAEALHTKASTLMRTAAKDPEAKMAMLSAVDAFVKAAPDDARAPRLLMIVAQRYTPADEQADAYRRVVKQFPNDRSAKFAAGKIRQLGAAGKTFQLEFTDALTGKSVSMNDLKGKVVVIDFWATWCGPCIAEMPNMKKLYAEYKDKGVEFIGVSLDRAEDQGGLKKLKDYCKENQIDWPQYFQGNMWESEFSTSWGINSIPTMFILDARGRLHSIEARGKLDKLIPELLSQRDQDA